MILEEQQVIQWKIREDHFRKILTAKLSVFRFRILTYWTVLRHNFYNTQLCINNRSCSTLRIYLVSGGNKKNKLNLVDGKARARN
jgi:hypothetical protein